MPASTAPAAKRAILSLLAARPGLTGVSLTWGAPSKEPEYTEEMIFLGNVRLTGDWANLGAGRRDENYTIDLGVAVRKYGDDEQSTEERAWALLDEVSAALAADKGLSGLLTLPIAIDEAEQANQPAGMQQWGAVIIAQLGCHARFTP